MGDESATVMLYLTFSDSLLTIEKTKDLLPMIYYSVSLDWNCIKMSLKGGVQNLRHPQTIYEESLSNKSGRDFPSKARKLFVMSLKDLVQGSPRVQCQSMTCESLSIVR